jgi:hypothetical protein
LRQALSAILARGSQVGADLTRYAASIGNGSQETVIPRDGTDRSMD